MPIRFTNEQVNRYLIHKQCLTPASQADLADTPLLSLLRRIGPLRARPTIAPYLSLWARLPRFSREHLDRELYSERSLLRVPCMHARLYIIPAIDYPVYYQATNQAAHRGMGDLDALLAEAVPATLALELSSEELARRVLEVMSGGGAHTIDELARWLPLLDTRIYHDPEHPELGYSRLGTRLVPAMCARGLLVRAQPRGGWRSTTYSYAALSAWAPEVDLASLTRHEAIDVAVRDYVSVFGPVTVGDISHWLGGLRRREIRAALMSLGASLSHVRIGERAGDYYMLREQIDALATCELEPAAIALLPPGDSFVAAYSDLDRFVADIYLSRITDRVGEPYGTVWLGNAIIGTWSIQVRDERLHIRFFEMVSPQTLAAVGEKARGIARLLDLPLSLDLNVMQDEDFSEDAIDARAAPVLDLSLPRS